ncbi:MAG: polysaccharide biosynthesis C-terminal domain-containing protein [Treponema sp.]|nr:polysaccharide biosynthesis C-terminal domain-containing protein [Treponema sp.]MBR4386164.1 polysaccharide biosynthesis C-terminal domain-containing protein [Treponema sp.]
MRILPRLKSWQRNCSANSECLSCKPFDYTQGTSLEKKLLDKKINRFGSAAFYSSALKIALPVMAQLLVQNLVSLIDNFMVSGLGDVKMSGVNISGQIIFLFIVFLTTVCTAAGIFMTQFSGAEDKNGMRQSFCFKLWVGLFIAALFMSASLFFPRMVLSFMVRGNTQAGDILDQGQQYLWIIAFTGIPIVVSTVIASSLREIGRVNAPLVISIFATLVNTFFNWVFIYGNLGAPRLEVRGAAIATVIARAVEMLVFIIYILARKPPFLIRVYDMFHVNFKLYKEICSRAAMSSCSEMLWAVAETVSAALYNGRGGSEVVSGMSASFAIANLFFVAFSGIITSTGVIIGKSLGRGDLELARKQKVWLLNGANVFGLMMTGVGLVTILLVPIVFRHLSPQSQSICKSMVFVMALYMPAWVYINGQFSVSRAGGDTMMGMLVDGISNVFVVIPGIFLMAKLTSIGPVIMYTIIKAVEFPKIAIATWWLKKEKWLVNLAAKNEAGKE